MLREKLKALSLKIGKKVVEISTVLASSAFFWAWEFILSMLLMIGPVVMIVNYWLDHHLILLSVPLFFMFVTGLILMRCFCWVYANVIK